MGDPMAMGMMGMGMGMGMNMGGMYGGTFGGNYGMDQFQQQQFGGPQVPTTSLTFTTQELDQEGKSVQKETNCDIKIFDNSLEVNNLINKAGELINAQNNQQAMEILTQLVDENKI